MPINNGIINQKGTPAFYSDIFANRPTYGYAGRVFISTDTGAIYEDTGSAWTLIADAGAGTTGTLQQVTTNGNTTNLGIVVQGININDGAGTGVNNIAIGSTALSINTTGQNNTAIGSNNLEKNTTGQGNTSIGYNTLINNISGINNTAIGVSALTGNTTGKYNIAVGNGSLTSNTTAEYNTAIGFNALTLNTTGANNTAIGYASMTQNTTASNNTAIGYSSLNLNTTGTQNTAIGRAALEGNLTGDNNVAVGYNALSNNSSGSTNTAIGVSALASNQTAGQNTAVGNSSLNANTTGSLNTAVGQGSLQLNTTGTSNTAIGTSSLAANTTANNNTAIGYSSLATNTTGIDNTAVGLSSLGVNTTGQYNAAFGRSSLNANTTGNFNTAIGSQALANITTGSQNIAIGYNSGGGITTGSSNTIIGTSVTGLPAGLSQNIILADGVGNVRLFSDANGLIGINQAVGSTIGGQLDIHSTQTYALVLNGLSTSNAYTAFSNASVGKWRIGNTYNAGANSFDIYNLGTSSNALSFNSTTNVATFIAQLNGTSAVFSSSVTAGSSGQVFLTGNAGTSSIGMRFTNTGGNSFIGLSNSAGTGYLTGTAYAFNIQTEGARDLQLGTNNAPVLLIKSGGNVLIGSSTDYGKKLQVSGEIVSINNVIGAYSTTSSTNYGFFNNGIGSLLLTNAGIANVGSFDMSTGIYVATSDINKKKDFEQSTLGLNAILGLKPTLYRMKDENNTDKHLGFIAQEVKEFLPQAFVQNDNFIGLNFNPIVAALVKSVQQLNEKLVRNNIN